MEPQRDYSMDVSIPGINDQAPAPEPKQSQNYEAPGMNHWALQEACKKELQKGVFPEFYIKAVEDKVATRERGRPMFRDQEWVRITLRGDKNTVMNRPVNDKDRGEQFPALYQAFKQGQTRANFGTPLEEWPLMSRSQVEALKRNDVFTVEDLAALDDNAIQAIGMGSREWMQQAKAYLENAADAATPAKLVKQIEQLQQQVDALQKNNTELGQAADASADKSKELNELRIEYNEVSLRVNELATANASLENRLAEVQMKYDSEKQAHAVTKGQLTKCKKQLETDE